MVVFLSAMRLHIDRIDGSGQVVHGTCIMALCIFKSFCVVCVHFLRVLRCVGLAHMYY